MLACSTVISIGQAFVCDRFLSSAVPGAGSVKCYNCPHVNEFAEQPPSAEPPPYFSVVSPNSQYPTRSLYPAPPMYASPNHPHASPYPPAYAPVYPAIPSPYPPNLVGYPPAPVAPSGAAYPGASQYPPHYGAPPAAVRSKPSKLVAKCPHCRGKVLFVLHTNEMQSSVSCPSCRKTGARSLHARARVCVAEFCSIVSPTECEEVQEENKESHKSHNNTCLPVLIHHADHHQDVEFVLIPVKASSVCVCKIIFHFCVFRFSFCVLHCAMFRRAVALFRVRYFSAKVQLEPKRFHDEVARLNSSFCAFRLILACVSPRTVPRGCASLSDHTATPSQRRFLHRGPRFATERILQLSLAQRASCAAQSDIKRGYSRVTCSRLSNCDRQSSSGLHAEFRVRKRGEPSAITLRSSRVLDSDAFACRLAW